MVVKNFNDPAAIRICTCLQREVIGELEIVVRNDLASGTCICLRREAIRELEE